MGSWEASWEFELPAENTEHLLLALLVRDLLHCTSFDIELTDTETELEVDFSAGDEIEGEVFRLLIEADVSGPEEQGVLTQFTEEILDELIAEAESLLEQRQELGSRPLAELAMRRVAEDDERWDLIVPDWLAPDGAVVPFGFRSFVADGDQPWPTDDVIDAQGRVVLVPENGVAHLFGVPAPTANGEAVADPDPQEAVSP